MKYIISESHDTASFVVYKIEQHLLLSDHPGSIYTIPQQIESTNHPDNGKYIVKIITDGKLKCDDIFPSQDLVDYDSTWFSLPDVDQESVVDIEE